MGQKIPGPHRRYSPPFPRKGQPLLKFQKSLGPRKYATSKFSSPYNFRGFILCESTMKSLESSLMHIMRRFYWPSSTFVKWGTYLYMSLFFVCPFVSFVHPSVVHHILGTVHNVIIIFGTHTCGMTISPGVFFFFLNFGFWVVRVVKGQKIAQNEN